MVARGCAIHNCVGMQLSETHAGTLIKSVLPSLCIHVCNDGLLNSSVLCQVVYLQTLRFRRSVTLPCCICFDPLLINLLTSYADVCSGECNDNNDNKYWNADGNTDPQLSRSFVTS